MKTSKEQRDKSFENILQVVCKFFNTSKEELLLFSCKKLKISKKRIEKSKKFKSIVVHAYYYGRLYYRTMEVKIKNDKYIEKCLSEINIPYAEYKKAKEQADLKKSLILEK